MCGRARAARLSCRYEIAWPEIVLTYDNHVWGNVKASRLLRKHELRHENWLLFGQIKTTADLGRADSCRWQTSIVYMYTLYIYGFGQPYMTRNSFTISFFIAPSNTHANSN